MGFRLFVYQQSKLNCEVLYDDLGYELRWVMDGDDIVMQLVGRVDPGEYMAFGLGKDDSKSEMIRSDTVVAWVDHRSKKGHAVDYYLESKEACTGIAGTKSFKGACPDVKVSPSATDSLTLLHSSLVNGFSMVTFKRPQFGVDDIYDQHVYSDGQQSVNWAIGPLNDRNEVSFHRLHSVGNLFIDFARVPKWNCPSPDGGVDGSISPSTSPTTVPSVTTVSPAIPPALASLGAPTTRPITRSSSSSSSSSSSAAIQSSSSNQDSAWEIPPIICPSDRTFRAQIGPTGGKKGYQAITGKVGWGIAWYINGLLIPELVVQRGKTYTFIVEGGNDPVHSSRRHPFYITDNAEGGYDYRKDEERAQQKIFAGAILRTSDGQVVPTAQGRLCEWKMPPPGSAKADSFADFFAFQRTLNLQCSPGKAAVIKWTPDADTPDTVYYQCWTHRYLGWKIRVVDSCENLASASILSSVHHVPSLRNSTFTGSSNAPVPSGSVNNPSVLKPSPDSAAKMHNVPSSQSLAVGSSAPSNGNGNSNTNAGNSGNLTQSKPKKKNGNKKRKQQAKQQGTESHSTSPQLQPQQTSPSRGQIESPNVSLRPPLIQQPVHFTIQPQIEAWMYQPAIYAAAYEAAVANPTPLSGLSHSNGHHNPGAGPTLDPFYMPSYSLSSVSDGDQGEVVFHKIPPPITLPKAPMTFSSPPKPSLPPPPSSQSSSSSTRMILPGTSTYTLIQGATSNSPERHSGNYINLAYQKNTRPRFSNKLHMESNNRLQGGFMPMLVTAKPQKNLISLPAADHTRNISRFGSPVAPSPSGTSDINRNTASDPSSSQSSPKKHVATSNTLAAGVINRIKNMAPVPYQRPLEVHHYSSPPSVLIEAIDDLAASDKSPSIHHHHRQSDSRTASSVLRPLHTSEDPTGQSTLAARRKQQINKKLIKNSPSTLKDLYYTVATSAQTSTTPPSTASTSHVVGSYSISSLLDSSPVRPAKTPASSSPTSTTTTATSSPTTSSTTTTAQPVYISALYPASPSSSSSPLLSTSSSTSKRLSSLSSSPSGHSNKASVIEIPTTSLGTTTSTAFPHNTSPSSSLHSSSSPSFASSSVNPFSTSSSSESTFSPSSPFSSTFTRTTQAFTHSTSAASVIITTPSPTELENEEAFTTTTNNPTTVTSIDGNRDYYNNHQYTHVPSVQVMELKSKELVDALTNHRSTSIFYENKNSSTTAISPSSKETTPTPMSASGDKESLADKINYYYTVTTDSSNAQTDDAEHYTNHRLSLSREVDSRHRSTTPITEAITYNPIYYHESYDVNNSSNLHNNNNLNNNNSSTDHTILNHILSLIAVGESPPEVKVFTRASKKDDGNLQGAFSTHVEVHQRYPRRRRSTLDENAESMSHQGKLDDRAAMKSLPLSSTSRSSGSSNRHLLSHPITLLSFIMPLIALFSRFF